MSGCVPSILRPVFLFHIYNLFCLSEEFTSAVDSEETLTRFVNIQQQCTICSSVCISNCNTL